MGKYSSDEGDNSDDERERTRVYIGDINSETTRSDLERIFKKFGSLFEVWLARYPPLFAFVAFNKRRDAEDAVREMNGESINGSRVQVNIARPRNRGRTSLDVPLSTIQTFDVTTARSEVILHAIAPDLLQDIVATSAGLVPGHLVGDIIAATVMKK